ncbi:DVU_1555 family C-GCAxxG-C-C protein [Desulfovibrio aminophilus]|uniref:DVU_1555 family C-GCAxxG-C-C protein n=1 Tax=Desulfovibrio aminophilus TaxID=81425 RepID=UPI0033981524
MSEILLDILPLAGKGYCCSQILGLLALRAQSRENPNLIRALSGLCHGLGQSGGTCGILSGGCCVLGLYLGKGSDGEAPLEQAELAVSTFVDWFTERVTPQYGGITCAAILGDESGKPDVSRCGQLLADAWARILLLLTEQGLDPAMPREE